MDTITPNNIMVDKGIIRPFNAIDSKPIMAIWLASNLDAHDFIKADYWFSHAESVKEQLLTAEIDVYEQQQRILGFIGLQGNYLAGLFVDKSSRSLGIGRQLLDCVKKKHQRIVLNVYQENAGAVRFYLREGLMIIDNKIDEATGCAEYVMQWQADFASESFR